MSNYITLEHLDQTVWSIVQKINQVKDSITESDPIFAASPAAGITQSQINNWNNNMFSLNAPENGAVYLLLGANSQNDNHAAVLPLSIINDSYAVAAMLGFKGKPASLTFNTQSQYHVSLEPLSSITSYRTYYLPDKDGTIALDSDISTHTHGNITNTGDITTTATISSGDRLVINDESESKLNNSSITFGTKTTQYLANNGTWQDLTSISNSSGLGQGMVATYVNKVILEASTDSPTVAQNTLTLTGTATTIKKVVTPTEDGDAANKKYVDDTVASVAASGGVSITNTLSSGTLIATINGTNIYAPEYTDADGVSY